MFRSLVLCLGILAGIGPSWAEEIPSALEFHFGRSAGWKDFPYRQGVGLIRGAEGTPELALAATEYQGDDDTDLLLHANDRLHDEASRYQTPASVPQIQRGFGALGGGSLVFRGNDPVVLQASRDALFSGGRGWGDFTIEFWLYPALVDDGETVFEWAGTRTSSGPVESQNFRVSFEDSHLVWTLQNLFAASPAVAAKTLTVTGTSTLVPKTWHHHVLRYQAGTGLLEYLIDGQTESLAYATPSGHQDGQPWGLVLGPRTNGQISLGGHYQGAMDEIRLSRAWIEDPQQDRFLAEASQKGTVTSRVFDLHFAGSTLDKIQAVSSAPGNTKILWSFRMADTIQYQWQFDGTTAKSLANPQNEDSSWIRFTPGQDLTRLASGRYLQLRIDLLPSGTGNDTPKIRAITVTAKPSPPPPAPTGIEVIPGDGQIQVKWKPVLQGSPTGYYVFITTRPGQAVRPIDAGNQTEWLATGLANDQIYYVSVAAYRGEAVGPLTREFAARPERKSP